VKPAFYAQTGTLRGDLVALLHPPYTMWHLSYVVIGSAQAPSPSLPLLGWTLVVFFLGLGVCAHALDELNGRPLGTRFSDGALKTLATVAIAFGSVVVLLGALNISRWFLLWAAIGLFLAVGYPLERPRWLHTDLGFAAAWGLFPVLAGHWIQTQRFSWGALLVGTSALLLSLVQRSLSTPARALRRSAETARVEFGTETWAGSQLLATWERPLRLLSLTVPVLAAGLLVNRF